MSRRILCLAIILLITVPAIFAGVDVRLGAGRDFSQLGSYELVEGTPARREAARDLLTRSLETALAELGLRRADKNPDVYVVSHVLVDVQDIEELSDPAYWEFITGVRSVDPLEIGAATLVVDIVDAETQALVWRGVATDTIKGNPQKMGKKIDKAVRRLFEPAP